MAGTKKATTDEGYGAYCLGTLAATPLFKVPAIGAGVVNTTVQDYFVTPSRLKIAAIAIYGSAFSAIDGSLKFNIVVGPGAYETLAPVAASGIFTLTGVPTTGDTNNYLINNVLVAVAQTTGNTLAAQATADAAAITALTGTTLVTAVESGNEVVVTANTAGAEGNFIATSASTTGGVTIRPNQTFLVGGSDASGVVPVANDNQQMYAYNQASSANGVQNQLVGGGSGITTNFAVPGQALFASDVLINPLNTPLILTTGGSAVFGDIPTAEGLQTLVASDAVFQRGQLLTLRVTTPGGGSITNFQVVALTEPRPLNSPSHTEPQFQWNGPAPLNGPQAPGPSLVNVRPTSGYTF